MRAVLTVFLVGAAFWLGTALEAAKARPQLVKTVHVQPAAYVPESCTEVARLCWQKKRSARIGGEK